MAQAATQRVRTAIVSFGLFCFAVLLSSYSAQHPKVGRSGRELVQQMLYPVQRGSAFLTDAASASWRTFVMLLRAHTQNASLRAEVQELRATNVALAEAAQENERLKTLLDMKHEFQLQGQVANVIGVDPSKWSQSVFLDKGSTNGVVTGQAVVFGRALVGQVISVGLYSSRVLLLTDHASAVDVVVQPTRVRGMVQGAGDKPPLLSYVLKEQDIKEGDVLVSSGRDALFPRGFLVGTVASVQKEGGKGLFRSIEIKPAADFQNLEEVFIVNWLPHIDFERENESKG